MSPYLTLSPIQFPRPTSGRVDLVAPRRHGPGGVSDGHRARPHEPGAACKIATVGAFEARGAVVATTGDGALMGAMLQLILVDDNFSTILPAVEEGTSCSSSLGPNMLASETLSTAAAAVTLIALSTKFGLSNPLNAMQLLFINILMDGPPKSLGIDPIDNDVMRKPPRKKDEPIISRRILSRVAFSASVIVVCTLVYTKQTLLFYVILSPHDTVLELGSSCSESLVPHCHCSPSRVVALNRRSLHSPDIIALCTTFSTPLFEKRVPDV
ncbi:hypothetical protein EDB86DRAFT_3239411 [Lactarius hatsudake]|nr:hypothetical protein EDB86DRAFT_3239411 [Lactarius hatsudake]